MNIKDIKDLADIMKNSGLSLIELEEKGLKIKLERNIVSSTAQIPMPIMTEVTEVAETAQAPEIKEGKVVVCPTVGVYYSSSSPEAAPYVTLGSSVKAGDTLCIIEAMKLMNEITADCDGEIVEILVGNGQVVEYGQPLFRIV